MGFSHLKSRTISAARLAGEVVGHYILLCGVPWISHFESVMLVYIHTHTYIYIPIGFMYAIYGNMDPINIPPMLAYIPYMDPMGYIYI